MMVRNIIPRPPGLSQYESELWEKWEREYSPLVIGDNFGESPNIDWPVFSELAWCSLYSLGFLIVNNFKGFLPRKDFFSQSSDPNLNGDRAIDFLKAKNKQIENFNYFLKEWNIDEFLNIEKQSFEKNIKEILDFMWRGEEKILGLHVFHNILDVNKYVLLWKTNNSIQNIELRYHRLIASRGIDLICSELLSNAFEHSLPHNNLASTEIALNEPCCAPFFILAKLCKKESAWTALKLHEKRPYLSKHEIQYYKLAVEENIDLLELVIGDFGVGFSGNLPLARLYQQKNIGPIKEKELIEFALLPEVSTKNITSHIEDQWKQYFNINDDIKADDLIPIVHGLSEVDVFVKEMGGFWRIHSNDTIVDINHSENMREHRKGSFLPGCVHYLIFPIRPGGYNRAAVANSKFIKHDGHDPSNLKLMDYGPIVYEGQYIKHSLQELSDEEWRKSILYFREKLLSLKQQRNKDAVLINLTPFDYIPQPLIHNVCALLADTLYRCRESFPTLICGASIRTESILKRFTAWNKIFLDRYIIPFISIYGESGENGVTIACSSELEVIKEELASAISLRNYSGVLKSEINKIDSRLWMLFDEVAVHNSGLYEIRRVSEDLEFVGKLKLGKEDIDSRRLLLGGRSFAEFRSYLLSNSAYDRKDQHFMRLGKLMPFYLHLSYLWADINFRNSIVEWLPVAVKNIDSRLAANQGKGTHFVAMLHPAIDMANTLLLDPEYSKADICEIRRMADLRWDSIPVRLLSGHKVVCIIDVINTGHTVSRLLKALNYIGAEPVGIISLIQIGNKFKVSNYVKHFTLCECKYESLINLQN